MVYLMRFGSVNRILGMPGEVVQDTKIKLLFEQEHPFEIGKKYRFLRHFIDDLEVTVIADSEMVEAVRELLNVETDDELILQWEAGKQVARKIESEELPQIQCLRSALRFNCSSHYKQEPYPVDVAAWIDNTITTITEKEIRMV